MSTGNIPWGRRRLSVTNLPPTCANYPAIWKPKPPRTFREYPGLHRHCFTFIIINSCTKSLVSLYINCNNLIYFLFLLHDISVLWHLSVNMFFPFFLNYYCSPLCPNCCMFNLLSHNTDIIIVIIIIVLPLPFPTRTMT